MLFNSFVFIFGFMPLLLVLFFLGRRLRSRTFALGVALIGSIVFYAFWNPWYVGLLGISIGVNFALGRILAPAPEPRRRWILIAGVATDLILLGYFKYTDFFIGALDSAFGLGIPAPHVLLPLGISFFTFTQIAYLVDIYRAEAEPPTALTYGLFVTFFPHLIIGPILHHRHIIPQFRAARMLVFSKRNFAHGLMFCLLGLGKKVLIADNIAPWANQAFAAADQLTLLDAWLGAVTYTLQIYYDFSGYSDIAVGLALMMNVKFPYNFDSPYQSLTIRDFWRRWHMTLSAFLKDYVYVSFGGNRGGELLRARNLMLTMVLGGLWHGAGWTYLIFGAIHGSYLIIHRLWERGGHRLPPRFAWALTFVSVVFGLVVFRSPTFDVAGAYLAAMTGFHGIVVPPVWGASVLGNLGVAIGPLVSFNGQANRFVMATTILAMILAVIVWAPNSQTLLRNLRPTRWHACLFALIAVACVSRLNQVTEFLYFQF